jgi:signal recognition particle subunit SRP19
MRERGKIRVWPRYFDVTNSRGESRKVSQKLAVRSPKLEEIAEASRELNLDPIMVNDGFHPKNPWRQTGFVLINENMRKTKALTEIARIIKKGREKPEKI